MILLIAIAALAAITITTKTTAETILPFAPSIVDLPKLKAFQMSGPEFNLNCTLNMQNIPTVQFKWFFSKTKDGLDRKELRNANEGSYELSGPKLTLDSNWLKWQDLMGYYWCWARNDYGESTSSKIEVLTTSELNFFGSSKPKFSNGILVKLFFFIERVYLT